MPRGAPGPVRDPDRGGPRDTALGKGRILMLIILMVILLVR